MLEKKYSKKNWKGTHREKKVGNKENTEYIIKK